jgi:hypothetical protein
MPEPMRAILGLAMKVLQCGLNLAHGLGFYLLQRKGAALRHLSGSACFETVDSAKPIEKS